MNFQLSILNGTVLKNLSFVNCFLLLLLFSHVWLFSTSWTAAVQASQSFTISQSLLKLKSAELVMPSNRLILCHPCLLLPSVFPSMRVFSNESAPCIRWPKYSSFSFSISPSSESSGLSSLRMDWFDFLAVWGTLKGLPQHHRLKAPILWCSADVYYPKKWKITSVDEHMKKLKLLCTIDGNVKWHRLL